VSEKTNDLQQREFKEQRTFLMPAHVTSSEKDKTYTDTHQAFSDPVIATVTVTGRKTRGTLISKTVRQLQ
jgi:hypothetical protein